MRKKLNYISLFSSAGIGCFAFKNNNFENVATVELLEERINIQKFNKVSSDAGYINGDITSEKVKVKIANRISNFNSEIDVLVATPPCQSISTLNKYNSGDIKRNSLVVESIQWVLEVLPKYFILENVRSFLKTLCQDKDGKTKTIEEAIDQALASKYLIKKEMINFNEYGTNSSRPRTLVIGTRKDLKNTSPLNIWPEMKKGKTLRESIGDYEPLNKMGQLGKDDAWHFYRTFDKSMLPWIKNLKEGESAFDNKDKNKRPHKIVDGKIIEHSNKMTNKYKRMFWDKIPPCVHTRSDVLAAQYTIHPSDNRVLSISELRNLLNIPTNFKFTELSDKQLLKLSIEEREKYIKKNELNIRRVIGEAVPFNIFDSIAKNIIKSEDIESEFRDIESNKVNSFEGLGRKYELKNANQKNEGAYYTPQSVVFDIIEETFKNIKLDRKIIVLEPSIGTANFIPQLIKRVGIENLKVIAFDTNSQTIEFTKKNIEIFYPELEIEFHNEDFIMSEFNEKVDFIIGNPPYLTLPKKEKDKYKEILNVKDDSNNLISYFFHKSFNLSNNISFVLPKYFLFSTEYKEVRRILSTKYFIPNIFDYGVDYFDVFVETISLIITKSKTIKTSVLNRKYPELSKIIEHKELIAGKIFVPYIDENFKNISCKIKRREFELFRDRQITKAMMSETKEKGFIQVIKSKNIFEKEIKKINGYDRFISKDKNLILSKLINGENLYIIPNFTYRYRIAEKPKNTITNGSVMVIKYNEKPDLDFMNTEEYKEYFKTIMSHSKFTLNLNRDIIELLGW